MKIIGEKINGTLKKVQTAIENRDADFIRTLATAQIEAGVDWLDVNAGTSPERELDDMLWLIGCVQEVAEVPLCLDSSNPKTLAKAVRAVQKTPIINSISLESKKIDEILPVAAEYGCDVIALALSDNGIPDNTEERLEIISKIIETTDKAGIPHEKTYIDPLVMAVATNTESGNIAMDTIRDTAAAYPGVHFCAGLSNISFGLPNRSIINQAFIILSIGAGLDTAILNPLDRGLRASILAAELLIGRDRHCQRYTRASKNGIIG